MNFAHKQALVAGDYRYWLSRRWTTQSEPIQHVLWVLLNPSTADAQVDDPTVRKAAGFSDRWGFKAMRFVNLYAYRSTSPLALKRTPEPVGAVNDDWIALCAKEACRIVVAWGQDPVPSLSRPQVVLDILRDTLQPLFCLGRNQNGHPCHPLMLPYDTPLVLYEGLHNESRRRTC